MTLSFVQFALAIGLFLVLLAALPPAAQGPVLLLVVAGALLMSGTGPLIIDTVFGQVTRTGEHSP